MKKLLITCVLFVAIVFGSIAQDSSLLWKVSGNGIEEPSYIFGTIHLICPQDYSMRDEIKNAFASVSQVYLELDFDDPQMMQKMMGMALLTNGKTAKDYLTDDEYLLLDAKFKSKIGVGMAQLQNMKPIMLLSMSYMSMLSCQPMSFETIFANMAIEQSKEVLGLETVEYQMGVFDEIPLDEQYDMIADMMRQEDKALNEFQDLVAVYKQEDIEGLLKLMEDSEWSMDDYVDAMINKRNKEWADKFDMIAKEKSTFFAVGAGHLGGKKGWLQLLKDKGYTVVPIRK
jgi:uncharacterized protein YbaP (TraB family)